MMTNKLGLIAGEGKMPLAIAQKAKEQNYEVFVLGIKGNAREEDYKDCATRFKYIRLGQLGQALNFLNRAE